METYGFLLPDLNRKVKESDLLIYSFNISFIISQWLILGSIFKKQKTVSKFF